MLLAVVQTTLLFAFSTPTRAVAQGPAPEVPSELTLRDAVRITLTHNPELRALAWETPKAEGRLRQAGNRPNPGLALEFENFSGSKPGLSDAEATLSIGQTLELGGKRSARVGTARAERSVILLDLESRRLDMASAAATRFLELLALETAGELLDEELRAAQEAASTTALRVRSGAAHPVEERRAEVELANAHLERVLLDARLSLARSRLAGLWGDPEARFTRLVGTLEPPPEVPGLDTLLKSLESAPSVTRWKDEVEARRSRLALERAQRIPDLGIVAGMRSLGESGERTLVGGVSFPLPFFDRNQGSTAEAEAALSQAGDERARASVQTRRAIVELHAVAVISGRKLAALRREVLPGASRAFEDMRAGFERGRFTYIDLLEARRTWIRARREDLAALLELHVAFAEIRSLTAGSAAEFVETLGGQP